MACLLTEILITALYTQSYKKGFVKNRAIKLHSDSEESFDIIITMHKYLPCKIKWSLIFKRPLIFLNPFISFNRALLIWPQFPRNNFVKINIEIH